MRDLTRLRLAADEILAKIRADREEQLKKLPPGHLESGAFPDPRASERHWMVFSTALTEVWIMMYCANTNAQGAVKRSTPEEWGAAFHAPTKQYHWPDASRVTLMQEGPR